VKMLYIKLFIEREKNIGQSAPECPFNIIIKVFLLACSSTRNGNASATDSV